MKSVPRLGMSVPSFGMAVPRLGMSVSRFGTEIYLSDSKFFLRLNVIVPALGAADELRCPVNGFYIYLVRNTLAVGKKSLPLHKVGCISAKSIQASLMLSALDLHYLCTGSRSWDEKTTDAYTYFYMITKQPHP